MPWKPTAICARARAGAAPVIVVQDTATTLQVRDHLPLTASAIRCVRLRVTLQ
jgi:hypothetical protein